MRIVFPETLSKWHNDNGNALTTLREIAKLFMAIQRLLPLPVSFVASSDVQQSIISELDVQARARLLHLWLVSIKPRVTPSIRNPDPVQVQPRYPRRFFCTILYDDTWSTSRRGFQTLKWLILNVLWTVQPSQTPRSVSQYLANAIDR